MKLFYNSLDDNQRDEFDAQLKTSELFGINVLYEIIETILKNNLMGCDNEGGYEFIHKTAREIVDNEDRPIQEIQAEINYLNAEYEKEMKA